MTYPQVIRFLESFVNFENKSGWVYNKSLKLKRISSFLEEIGNPHDALRCIHVAGSKGKGSTCAFIAYVLRQSGYKVGLYTSPHLVDFRERIRILNGGLLGHQASRLAKFEFEGMIPQDDLVDLIQRLKPEIINYNKGSKYGPLTFFEVYTALAFQYFKEKNVDFVVLETGMGGRLDATNVVDPFVCVLTPISYEHTQKLGNTLRKIALEKAGIIKNHKVTKPSLQQVIVISAPQEKEVMEIFKKRCTQKKAKLIKIQKKDFQHLKVNLIGEHQKVNAGCAIKAVEALGCYGIKIKDSDIKKSLLATCWPCRCEVVSRNPLFILDGAQNTASIKVLIEAIKNNFKYRSLILILGISNDKDIAGICRELDNFADKIIVTQANNPRASQPGKIAKYFNHKDIYITRNTKKARNKAFKLAEKKDLILVTGSLFVTGEFKKM